MSGRRFRKLSAFTLVELLVVVGIIATLLAILLPAMTQARRSARSLQCASNIRQFCAALINYATDNNGRFPSNYPGSQPWEITWDEPDVLGAYLPAETVSASKLSGIGGGVLVCPDDATAFTPWRSYAMNVWASTGTSFTALYPDAGKLWAANVRNAPSMILAVETWHNASETVPATGDRWSWPRPVAGYASASPGLRFGAGTGLTPTMQVLIGPGPKIRVKGEIAFYRHRSRSNSDLTDPDGAANFGYADGHVALKRLSDVADPLTGRSTFDSMWSPNDRDIESALP